MLERAMEYRGSKSVMFTNNNTVKEQRVGGHRCVKFTHLRFALMGFERNYQIRIPSNHLNTSLLIPPKGGIRRRLYTTLEFAAPHRKDNLNP